MSQRMSGVVSISGRAVLLVLAYCTLAPRATAQTPDSGVAVDHVFIAIQEGDSSAFAALRDAGITIAPGTNRHEGQGTASVVAMLGTMYLELIWADSTVSVDSSLMDTRDSFRAAAAHRPDGPSPFGLGLRRGAGPIDYGVPVFRHTADWMKPGTAIEVLTDTAVSGLIGVFVVPEYMAMPSWLPQFAERSPEALRHPLGVQAVTAVRIASPSRHRPEVLRTLDIPGFKFVEADEPLLTLEFDGGSRGERIDLRPALPLVLIR
jgi:hypothetical protein